MHEAVARNYAEALFALGEEQGESARYGALLEALAAAVSDAPAVTAVPPAVSEPMALPEFVMRPWIRAGFAAGLLPWPEGAIDYLKFPATISGEAFVQATGWKPLFSLAETLAAHRARRSDP
mgnify:CR=1 FL=1